MPVYHRPPVSIEEAKRIVRAVMGPPKRELKGEEYAQVMTMLMLMEPCAVSNNQHTLTEEYIVGDQDNYTEYHVTYFGLNEDPIISVLEKEDNV